MKIVLIETREEHAEAAQALSADRPLLLVTDTADRQAEGKNTVRIVCQGGRGKKLRAAFAYAFGEMKADAVLTLPANGKGSAEDVEKTVTALKEGASVAVCDINEPSPLIFGWAFRLLTRFTAGLTVSPWASMRGYSADCADLLASVKGDSTDYEVALLQAIVTEKMPLKQFTVSKNGEKGKTACKKSLITTVLAGLGIVNQSQSLKFLLSSAIAFVVDTLLLMIVAPLLPWKAAATNEAVAQTIAWAVSSLSNFTINQKFVFGAKGGTLKAMGQYYSLAIFVMLGKQVLLYLFSTLLSLPLFLSKLVCEVSFFLFNYFVQKKLIFRRKKAKTENGG